MKAVYNPEKAHQRYVLKDGTEVIGASSIAKMDDEIGSILAKWGNNLGQRGIDCNKFKDSAADAGNAAHFMIECHFKHKQPILNKLSSEAVEIGEGIFKRFMDWWVDNDLTFLHSEIQLQSETYRYGGTTDLIAKDSKDRIWILDVKTSKRVYWSHKTQIAGLGQLWNENMSPPYHKLMVIRLPSGISVKRDCDIEPYTIYNPKEMEDAFLALANAINKKKLAGGYE
jgi:hypothetical protein